MQHREPQRAVREPLAQDHPAVPSCTNPSDTDSRRTSRAVRTTHGRAATLHARAPGDEAQPVAHLRDDRVADAPREHRRTGHGGRQESATSARIATYSTVP